jgi:hypothetical protein
MLEFPLRSAEPKTEGEPEGEAGAPENGAKASGSLPDPPVQSSTRLWRLTVRYDHGKVSLVRALPIDVERPVSTPRHVGRYAFELWIGQELLERHRFDFPLLGAEPTPGTKERPLHPQPEFAPGAEVERTILLPNVARARRAQIVDRATGVVVAIPWPPESEAASAEASPEPEAAEPMNSAEESGADAAVAPPVQPTKADPAPSAPRPSAPIR